MLILAAADLHGNFETYHWLMQVVRDHSPSALVLAGDLLGAPESYETAPSDHQEQASRLLNTLRPLECPLLYVMGNDDWIDQLTEDEKFVSLHARRFDLGDFNFVGYPYTTPFMGGIYEKPEEEMTEDLLDIGPMLDTSTVFLTHGPVKGILDGGHGSVALASLLQRRPVLAHIHGHSHSSFGREGKHFNVAAAYEIRAMLIDLKTMDHHVLRG